MAFDWFRVDAAMADHPKIALLEADLGNPLAGWYVIRCWSWLVRYAARGRLPAALAPQLEAAARWRGEPGELVRAFVRTGLLDKTSRDPENNDLEWHDWWEKQGALVEKSMKDAALKRQKRRADGACRASAGRADGALTGRDGTGRDEKPFAGVENSGPPGALRDAMDAIFKAARHGDYHWRSQDETAVGALLGQASSDHAEILRRWGICLAHTFPTYDTVTELSRFWNKCAAAQSGGEQKDNRKSPIRAEDVDPAAFTKGATHDF
jgi:hypothetical protein